MKRIIALLLVAAFFVGVAFADEAVLLDFAALVPDWPTDAPTEHEATLIDFRAQAGASISEADRDVLRISLAIPNWEIVLNSSARSIVNQGYSFVRPATVRDSAAQYAGETVMGVRVMFPTEPVHANALISPPFNIPAYMDLGAVDENPTEIEGERYRGRKFDSLGVVKNVGVLKSLSINVHGLNFPHGLSVIISDERGREQEIFMGYLNFDGWRTLTWNNPNYITDVRNRQMNRLPLYPNLSPLVRLEGIRIYRDAAMTGGDFISYIKDISVVYDRAVLQLERDIDDEMTWLILQDREAARRNAELQRLGELQVMRFLEQRRMHDENNQQ